MSMFKPLRLSAIALAASLAATALPAHAVAPGIAPAVFIGVFTAAGPVLTLGQEALASVGFSKSEQRAKAEEALKTTDWEKAKLV